MLNNRYLRSLITSLLSIVPMIVIVIVLSFFPIMQSKGKFSGFDYMALTLGAIFLICGLTLFQVGATKSLSKVGEYMGSSLSKQAKIAIVIIFSFLLGALITCAEPSILIVASQVQINMFVLIGSIAIGVGLFVVIGVIRVLCHKSLKIWYLLFYFLVFGLIALIGINEKARPFLPFIFDAGGITTGSATVPFILALGAGIAAVRGGKNANEDSFGLVGMASIGPIISMAVLVLLNNNGFSAYQLKIPDSYSDAGAIFLAIGKAFIPSGGTNFGTLIEVAMALLPIMAIFFIYELVFIKLPKVEVKSLLNGFLFSYFGLVIFLTGVNSIMSPFGTRVGVGLGCIANDWSIVIICFVIGLVTILCEPAVHVLTTQINEISDGNVSKKTVLITLSIGVGIAIGLAAIRTLFNFNILYILIPGYVLSILLMFICPNIFTAIAFDAGGTASGPMSTSFVLPMLIGITYSKNPSYGESSVEYYTQSFGVVALIALTPILAIQFLGVIEMLKKKYALRVMRGEVKDPNDSQIIHFR